MNTLTKLTIASNRIRRGSREGPLGVREHRGSEERLDGLVGGARIAQPVQPQNKAPRHRAGFGRLRAFVIEKHKPNGDAESECEERN